MTEVRGEPYEPIDANRPRYGTAEQRTQALSETLLWGWSALIVLGAAYGIHEILAQGSLSLGYLGAGLVASLLIGATEFHIVCNALSTAATGPRATLFVATACCLGFLFVFNHVAVVSALGTPRLAYDAWFRSVGAVNTDISTRLQSMEFGLEQLIGAQYEPRGEEEVNGIAAADTKTTEFAAVLGRWSDAFTAHSVPLKSAIGGFMPDPAPEHAEDAQAQAAAIARELANFTGRIRLETSATGLSRYLNTPNLVEDTVAQRHLRAIASDLERMDGFQVAELPRDRSAGISALKRLGGSITDLVSTNSAAPLTTRDYIGLGSSALALLFVLLLQANRWRFRIPDLPEPPDNLNAREHRI